MQRIRNFLYDCVSFIAFITAPPAIDGNTPEFKAEREIWRQTCTQETVLADFTKFLQRGNCEQYQLFRDAEWKALEKAFSDYSHSDNCWDQQSLELFFLSQIPQEEDFKILLRNCMPSLWTLMVYFAQWPFNTAFGPTTRLTFPALVRAIPFLCGRYHRIFLTWEGEDEAFNSETDQKALEHIFRALAATRPAEQQSRPAPTPQDTAKSSSQRDVLDLLSVSQPFLNENTQNLTRAQLTPIADRLLPPTPTELSELVIPAAGQRLIPILELAIPLTQHSSQFGKYPCYSYIRLRERLEAAQNELEKQEEVTFSVFQNHLDSDAWAESNFKATTLYDSIALLFNTFPNPQSLITGRSVNWFTGSEESLSPYVVRK
ncbi:unnamed protein product [Clonostachys rosea]|uniref:Uncharacterized protein n=1 Tax=Bionectria ochroleuca TaxID=29856 RepID=A0ABY6TQN5_BIOOC|nr:unnamed protein product [Clonostachys rosea]